MALKQPIKAVRTAAMQVTNEAEMGDWGPIMQQSLLCAWRACQAYNQS
jgi:hypothetical protein